MKTTLLDCTLRDGGYYTDWDFPKPLVKDYFAAMESLSPVQYVEIGYRSKPLEGYYGEYFYCPAYVLQFAKSMMPSKKIAVMLNEKDVKPEDTDELLTVCKPYVTMIRIALSPDRIPQAVELAKSVKKMGFEVAFNIMYLSKIANDDSILAKLRGIDEFVDYIYLVDSYGGVFPDQVRDVIRKFRTVTQIPLGFHGHNNMEMAMINSVTAYEEEVGIIDGTICGMGRGAGNLKTELMLTWLAFHKKLDISFNELSLAVAGFEVLQKKYEWGTNLPYMVAGANSLPQKDVMDWMSKKRYSISGLITALTNQKNKQADNEQYPNYNPTFKASKVLILGGGESVKLHAAAIIELLKQNPDIVIIHSSGRFAAEFQQVKNVQIFALVGNEGYRLNRIFGNLEHMKSDCVLPTYPRKMGTYVPDALKDNTFQLEKMSVTDRYQDSPLSVALQTAQILQASQIFVLGFDGYSTVLDKTKFELISENQYVLD
jgi:4-hydroxy 2-oxovalerate aldolase